jgi:hypothetical protein
VLSVGRHKGGELGIAESIALRNYRRFPNIRVCRQSRFDLPEFDPHTADLHLLIRPP